jgi:pyrimidine deaminase RibD-like protein
LRSHNETKFMRLAVDEARKSRHVGQRLHPEVGAVVTRGQDILATAHHGELVPCDHAEFTALEGKLRDVALSGCTIYTTLEPCTERNPPKVACVERLRERKVERVVIGMLDPNQDITGRGVMRLRHAGIAVDFFPTRLMQELEELNRAFVRYHESRQQADVVCHGTKYDVPDRTRFWNNLLENATTQFTLVGNTNKSWFERGAGQSEKLGNAIIRIVRAGGRVVIVSGMKAATVDSTNKFIADFVTSRADDSDKSALEERFIYIRSTKINYSAVISDDRMLIMPRLNSQRFTAEAMVLELSRQRHPSQFATYQNDIEVLVEAYQQRLGIRNV